MDGASFEVFTLFAAVVVAGRTNFGAALGAFSFVVGGGGGGGGIEPAIGAKGG